jgi:Uma2 family endonuclease
MTTAVRRKVPHHMSVDEFIAWVGDGGWQLIDGEPRAMAPANAAHGIIHATLAFLLNQHLYTGASPGVVVTDPEIQPRVRSRSNMRVPDLAVTCVPVQAGQIALPDPLLIVEILSPSNEADTWENVWTYATIPSVQEILLLRSASTAADLRRRCEDSTWPDEPIQIGRDDALHLASIGLTIPLPALYARAYLTRSA